MAHSMRLEILHRQAFKKIYWEPNYSNITFSFTDSGSNPPLCMNLLKALFYYVNDILGREITFHQLSNCFDDREYHLKSGQNVVNTTKSDFSPKKISYIIKSVDRGSDSNPRRKLRDRKRDI